MGTVFAGRIFRRILTGIAVTIVVMVATIIALSEWRVRRQHDVPLPSFAAGNAPLDTTEGRRLAILVGCLEGCHGREGEGGTERADGIFAATAPTLSAVLPSYSDAELVRLLRFGVRRDGRSAVGMPSATFYPMSDGDLRALIGYLRLLPPRPAIAREMRIEAAGRVALALGLWKTSADMVDRRRPRLGDRPLTSPEARGRYLASIICSECHGLDFQGDGFTKAPPLGIVRGYSEGEFATLLRTGVPRDGRTLDRLMGVVMPRALVQLTDAEVRALWLFARALPTGGGVAPAGDGATTP